MPDTEITYDPDYLATLEADDTEVGAEFDQDADYAAPPPPLPDGWYLAKLRNIGAKDAGGTLRPFVGPRPWGQIPATFFTQIEAIVVDPGGAQDGKRTNRYNVTTHTDVRQNNTSSAALVYRAVTGQPIPGVKQAAHMGLIMDLFNGQEPLVKIRVQLEGEAQEASKAYQDGKKAGRTGLAKPKVYRGERNFMKDGKVVGYVDDPASGERVVGRPSIVDIKPQDFQA